MHKLQRFWYWFSRVSFVVKIWHAVQVSVPLAVAISTAINAFADDLPLAQTMAFTALALGGTLLCVTQLRQLLDIPIAVNGAGQLDYGLAYTGVTVGYHPMHAEAALQVILELSNGSRMPIRYKVERFDLVIGNTTLSHKKNIFNTGTFIPLGGRRVYRDSPFSQAEINGLVGGSHTGTLEAHFLYGTADGEMSRRYKLKLHLTINLMSGASIADVVLERVHDLLSSRARNAKWMNCKLVLRCRSQFFHKRLFLSSQAKLRSTTQRLGMTANL